MTTMEHERSDRSAKTLMEKAVEDFRKELATVRTGRAECFDLDNVRVDYQARRCR